MVSVRDLSTDTGGPHPVDWTQTVVYFGRSLLSRVSGLVSIYGIVYGNLGWAAFLR